MSPWLLALACAGRDPGTADSPSADSGPASDSESTESPTDSAGGDSPAVDSEDTGPPPLPPANVLVIVIDDLGYADTSIAPFADAIRAEMPAWNPDIPTPNLATFATQGRSYTSYHTAGPACTPTRGSLMTGLDPHGAGLWMVPKDSAGPAQGLGMKPGSKLLPELLLESGFHTAAIGKWHIGSHDAPWGVVEGECLPPDTPQFKGFESYFGFVGGSHEYVVAPDCGDLVRATSLGGELTSYSETGECPYEAQHLTEVFTDQALAQVQALEQSGAPWFLYVAYNAPHTPFEGGAQWLRDRSAADPAYAELVEACAGVEPSRGSYAEDYCLTVTHLDAQIGRLIAAIGDDTLVVVASDNGGSEEYGSRNTPFRGEKHQLYNGGLIVPLIARAPNIPPATLSSALLYTPDLFATILDAVGVAVPTEQIVADYVQTCDEELQYRVEPIVGRSFVDDLTGTSAPTRDEAIFEFRGKLAIVKAIDGTPWKLIGDVFNDDSEAGPDGPLCDPGFELYDLDIDPRESTDIGADWPWIADELEQRLHQWVEELELVPEALGWYDCCLDAGGVGCAEACGACL